MPRLVVFRATAVSFALCGLLAAALFPAAGAAASPPPRVPAPRVMLVEGYAAVRVPVSAQSVTVPVGTVLLFAARGVALSSPAGTGRVVAMSAGDPVSGRGEVVVPLTGSYPQDALPVFFGSWIAARPGVQTVTVTVGVLNSAGSVVASKGYAYEVTVTSPG